MIKRLAITWCLLTGPIWAGGLMSAAYAADPVPVAPSQSLEQTSLNPTLSLSDLPSGFRELPPQVAAEVSSKFETLRTQLTQAGMKPNKFFAYINPETFQIVFGFTGAIPNPPDRAKLDAIIEQVRSPSYQRELFDRYREALKASQGIEILEYGAIEDLNNVAEASTGMTVAVSVQGQPLRLDVATFRRSDMGAFVGVMYPNGQTPAMRLGEVARKLDDRILQASSGVNPLGTSDRGVSSPIDPTNPSLSNPTRSRDSGVASPSPTEAR